MFGITKEVLQHKVKVVKTKKAGISCIKNINLSEKIGKWLIATNKAYKIQSNQEIERI